MDLLITFISGIFCTLAIIRSGVFKPASITVTTRLISEDAPILLSCKINCTGVTPIQEIEYAEDLDLDELEEHLAELDMARDVLQDYIEDIQYGDDEDEDDESFY